MAQYLRHLGVLFTVSFSVLLLACTSGTSESSDPPAVSLDSLSVTPNPAQLPSGFVLRMTARGVYSDGSSQDLSNLATWESSNTGVAAPGGSGFVTGVALGTATITATADGVSGSASLEVVTPVLTRVEVSPNPAQMAIGGTLAFRCTAFFDGGFSSDVSTSAGWHSSDTSVATIDSSGQATGITAGRTGISATYDGFQDTAELTTLPISTLDAAVPNSASVSVPALAADARGNAVAVWSYTFSSPGELYSAVYVAGSGWSPKQDLGFAGERTYAPAVGGNGDGIVIAVWSTDDSVLAKLYSPGGGWGTTVTLDAGTVSATPYAQDPRVVLDATGNALAVWRDRSGGTLMSCAYGAGTGWGSAAPISTTGFSREDVALEMNRSGAAVLLWENADSDGWELFARPYQTGVGWGADTLLYTSNLRHTPAVAVDESGAAWATWVQLVTEPSRFQLVAARRSAGAWGAAELVTEEDVPKDPQLGADATGGACLAWRHTWTDGTVVGHGVSAARWKDGDGWSAPALLDSSTGASVPRRPRVDASGLASVSWVTDSFDEGRRLEYAEWAGEWGAPIEFSFMGLGGLVTGVHTDVGDDGGVVVSWGEASGAQVDVFAFRFELTSGDWRWPIRK